MVRVTSTALAMVEKLTTMIQVYSQAIQDFDALAQSELFDLYLVVVLPASYFIIIMS